MVALELESYSATVILLEGLLRIEQGNIRVVGLSIISWT